MSAPLAGKFQDHYVILGLNPKADAEAIKNGYFQAAQKYTPDNPLTGDKDKFESVNLAFEVLSDPQLRAEFDKVKGLEQDAGPVQFSGSEFFHRMKRAGLLRVALMAVLYDRRIQKPFRPSLAMRDVETLMDATINELTVALWYLKTRNLVMSDDKSSLQVTQDGIDYLERNNPTAESVMAMIRPTGIAGAPAPESEAPPPPAPAPVTAPAVPEPLASDPVSPAPALLPEDPSLATPILALLKRASGERFDAAAAASKLAEKQS